MRKSLAFLVLLIVLSALEELAGGWWRGRSVAQTVAELSTDPALQVLADSLLLLLVLVPLVATVEISRALGPGVLARTLRN